MQAILAAPLPGAAARAGDDVKRPQRGSWFSALFNRSSLAAHAAKMQDGTITAAEVDEYLRMGGSIGQFESYDAVHAFFVGSVPVPVLNLFIRGPFSVQRPLPADRLASLAALLGAGADPNFRIVDYSLFQLSNLSPLNFAAAGDDADAIALLLRHGARTDIVEKGYLRPYGPALALCSQARACDALAASGADLHYVDGDGNSLVHLAANRLVDGASALAKLAWLDRRKLAMNTRNNAGRTPLDLARMAAEVARNNGLGEAVVEAAEQGIALLGADRAR
ncbi:MAG: hypothetical protein AB7P21_00540 [Lautropia sp.]